MIIKGERANDNPKTLLDMDTTHTFRPPLLSQKYTRQAMAPVIGERDMFFTYVMALFLLTNAASGATGGAASLTYLILGAIIFFIPSVIATMQLAVLLPHEGGLYNWTYHALGSFWSFFVAIVFWLTGILAAITSADAFVTIVQGLNPTWLQQPWQQGLVILALVGIATLIGIQRMRMTQQVINVTAICTIIAVVIITIAAIVWLASGHASQTNFSQLSNWNINPGNFFFFGIITTSYIGASGPLTLAGELRDKDERQKKTITRHLLWGSIVVFVCYFLVTMAVLVIRGQAIATSALPPFEGFTAVDVTLGKWLGNITIIFFLMWCVATTTFYNYASSRVLMATAIDRHISIWFGKLSHKRVPQNAFLFQAIFTSVLVVLLFMVAPYLFIIAGSAVNTLVVIYNVSVSTTTLVWTIATCFFFINIVFLYRRNPRLFRSKRILPLPLLWLSVLIGTVACILTIAGLIAYSWIPQLVANSTWGLVVGSIALVLLIICVIGSLVGNSEATSEDFFSEVEDQSKR